MQFKTCFSVVEQQLVCLTSLLHFVVDRLNGLPTEMIRGCEVHMNRDQSYSERISRHFFGCQVKPLFIFIPIDMYSWWLYTSVFYTICLATNHTCRLINEIYYQSYTCCRPSHTMNEPTQPTSGLLSNKSSI